MKQLLTSLLLLIGLTGLAQPTYLDLTIQLDQYPPETAWIITQGADTVVVSPSYASTPPNTLVEQRVFLNSNTDYTFTVTDAFGDGICCEFGDGFFITANNCEGVIFEEYEFGSSIASYDFNLIPCELPTSDITFRVNLANAPPEIETPGVLGNWNGWQVIPMEYDEDDEWFVTIPIPTGNYIWKFADFNNPDLQEVPVGIDGASCFLFDQFGFINRTLEVIEGEDELLPNYCWESCLPCGAIPGCSDPSALNWNPWANFDDGSCISQTTECVLSETLLEIVVTPDPWGGEVSWILYGDLGGVASAPVGTYAGSSPGIPVTTGVCVSIGQSYDIIIEDSYGDGIVGVNGQPGNIQILDCEGEILYNLQDEHPDGNFGYTTGSDSFTPTVCEGITDLVGCTDPNYVEYNPEAIIDNPFESLCVTPIVLGCLDETQFNYNPDANTEDVIQFCDYTLTITDGVGDGWFGSWLGIHQSGYNSPQYQIGPNDGNEILFNVSGLDASKKTYIYFFVTPQSINSVQQCGFSLSNSEGNVIIEVPFFSTIPFTGESGWYVYEIDLYCGNTCEPYVYGCLDTTAVNYNEESNTEDESCYYQPGCTSAGYLEYYTQEFEADFDNGSCQTLAMFGCTIPTSINYDFFANVDNGTCIEIIIGCMDPTALNYNPNANLEQGVTCIDTIYGCTDETALNYNELANTDNATCIEIIEGCTNPLAINYNELANIDDFSCILPIYGCTNSEAFNYNELANIDNGSCIDIIEGCTDPTAFNFNPEANTEDFSCEPFIYGCTDPQAANYDELANADNGTCETVYANCIDPVVEAYNLLDLENSCFAWVIDVSPSCCNSEWAEGCQTLYNYCDENTVTNVEEFGETQITVFPNPTRDIITIASSLNINATLYNAVGQPVYQNNNVQQIDLSKYEAGIYNLILTYNDLQFTKKIVKQ